MLIINLFSSTSNYKSKFIIHFLRILLNIILFLFLFVSDSLFIYNYFSQTIGINFLLILFSFLPYFFLIIFSTHRNKNVE